MAQTGTIDDIVKNENPDMALRPTLGLANKIWSAAKAGAMTYLSAYTVGINGILSGLAFSIGSAIVNSRKKAKNTFDGILGEYATGTAMGMLGSYMYDKIYQMIPGQDWGSRIYRALANIFPATAAWIAAYFPISHVIKKDRFDPQKIASEMKAEYGRTYKDTLKYLGIPLAATINFPPQYMQYSYPAIVASDTAWRAIKG